MGGDDAGKRLGQPAGPWGGSVEEAGVDGDVHRSEEGGRLRRSEGRGPKEEEDEAGRSRALLGGAGASSSLRASQRGERPQVGSHRRTGDWASRIRVVRRWPWSRYWWEVKTGRRRWRRGGPEDPWGGQQQGAQQRPCSSSVVKCVLCSWRRGLCIKLGEATLGLALGHRMERRKSAEAKNVQRLLCFCVRRGSWGRGCQITWAEAR